LCTRLYLVFYMTKNGLFVCLPELAMVFLGLSWRVVPRAVRYESCKANNCGFRVDSELILISTLGSPGYC
jgi:hypothetical protein